MQIKIIIIIIISHPTTDNPIQQVNQHPSSCGLEEGEHNSRIQERTKKRTRQLYRPVSLTCGVQNFRKNNQGAVNQLSPREGSYIIQTAWLCHLSVTASQVLLDEPTWKHLRNGLNTWMQEMALILYIWTIQEGF